MTKFTTGPVASHRGVTRAGSSFLMLALWGGVVAILFASAGWSEAHAQARTPLEEFKAFLKQPPAIEELILERDVFHTPPPMAGTNQFRPAGRFFQIRHQTNGYFIRQMDTHLAVQQPHTAHESIEGWWNGDYWKLLNNQLDLWQGTHSVDRLYLMGPSICGSFLGLGLDERIIPSTIVWRGDKFSAQGKGGARFEGRIEEMTPTGLAKRIATWSLDDPDTFHKVDYEYRPAIHPWLPAVIKPFRKVNYGVGSTQAFYVRSLKLGGVPNPPEAFSPVLYTNYNTIVVSYTNGVRESVSHQGRIMTVVGQAKASPPAMQPWSTPTNPPGTPAPLQTPPPAQPPPLKFEFNAWVILPLVLVAVIAGVLIFKIEERE